MPNSTSVASLHPLIRRSLRTKYKSCRNSRASLGDYIYRSIMSRDYIDPDHFLPTLDLSSEHKILDLKNRIEASVGIWKRKMNAKDGKSSWGLGVSLEKREMFEDRAETILLIIKQRFPGIPQSVLDIRKIQYNWVEGKQNLGKVDSLDAWTISLSVPSKLVFFLSSFCFGTIAIVYCDDLADSSNVAPNYCWESKADLEPAMKAVKDSRMTKNVVYFLFSASSACYSIAASSQF
ncbi:hypothetical protein Vadar_033239 [Vaccinium darrowii]|uniref:Uncharacterized protein n=1 Tax=Vaccinium darrowii TaxID=229202 RepID=A0ACB7Y4E4_9ERIC|nr:hypothetical protein Vadar_033239 [Vaccinium darrowii]